mmetsp:Transcript_36997/g.66568  ORF Transcript_36997/g.66568 Transcript_36997/m.66568 type:complete len:319 (-) Transcript_36997:91-1047(-)
MVCPFIGSVTSSSSSLLSLEESSESLLSSLLESPLSSSVRMSAFTCLDFKKSKSEVTSFFFAALLVASSSLSESELLLSLSSSLSLLLLLLGNSGLDFVGSAPGFMTTSSFAQNFDLETLSSLPCLDADIPMADRNSSFLRLVSSCFASLSDSSSSSFFELVFFLSMDASSFSCFNLSYFDDPSLCFDQGRYSSLLTLGGPFGFENAKLTFNRAVPAKLRSKYFTADSACAAVWNPTKAIFRDFPSLVLRILQSVIWRESCLGAEDWRWVLSLSSVKVGGRFLMHVRVVVVGAEGVAVSVVAFAAAGVVMMALGCGAA